jgi:hypothetical protein
MLRWALVRFGEQWFTAQINEQSSFGRCFQRVNNNLLNFSTVPKEEAEGRCVSELHQCNNNKNYQENDLELQRSIIQQQKEHQKEVVQTTKRISIWTDEELAPNTLALQSAKHREEIRQLELDVETKTLNWKKVTKELCSLKQELSKYV